MRRTLTVALLFACCILVSSTAFAQDIVKLNQEGIEAFTEGRFADAAQKFNEAYSITPEAPLKKNEAVAWFKAERCSEALAAAKEYLALGVENELSTREAQTVVVQCYVKRAETELAAGNRDAAKSALTDARASNPTEEDGQAIAKLESDIATQVAAENETRRAEMEAAEAEEARRAQVEKRKSMSRVGLGVAGGGAAIVLGTLIYHITLATGTSSKFKDASAAGDRETYDKLGKKLETGNWLVPTLYAVGLATTGAGVYLWWSYGDRETDTTAAQALGGFETIGATASWKF